MLSGTAGDDNKAEIRVGNEGLRAVGILTKLPRPSPFVRIHTTPRPSSIVRTGLTHLTPFLLLNVSLFNNLIYFSCPSL
jgi:hypothetical protein